MLRIDGRVRVGDGERRTDTAQTRIRRVQNICGREGKDENGELSVGKARVVQQRARGGALKIRQQVNVGGLESVRVLGLRFEGNGVYLRENLGNSFAEGTVLLGVYAVEGVELIQRHGRLIVGARPAVGTVQTQEQVHKVVEGVVAVALVDIRPGAGVFNCAAVQVSEGAQQLLLGGVAVTLAGRGSLRFLGRLNHAAVAGRRHGAINRAVRGHGEGIRQRGIGADLHDGQVLFVALNVFKPVLGVKRRIDGGRINTRKHRELLNTAGTERVLLTLRALSVVADKIPGAVTVPNTGNTDLLLHAGRTGSRLIGERDRLTLRIGGEQLIQVRVIAKVNTLKRLAVGVQVLRALTLAGLRLQNLRGGERLIGEVLAGQRNLTQNAVGVILQFGAFPAAQDGVDEAELLSGGVPCG